MLLKHDKHQHHHHRGRRSRGKGTSPLEFGAEDANAKFQEPCRLLALQCGKMMLFAASATARNIGLHYGEVPDEDQDLLQQYPEPEPVEGPPVLPGRGVSRMLKDFML